MEAERICDKIAFLPHRFPADGAIKAGGRRRGRRGIDERLVSVSTPNARVVEIGALV
jgi:hypothetical protein